MDEENEEEAKERLTKKEKSAEDAKKKEEIKEILSKYPAILQITSIGFKETESHIRQARPTVRCVHDINTRDLIKRVVNAEWKLKSPRIVVLIMSNVGSVHNWTNAKQIKSFQKGLMKAAENTNMWLIMNGIDMGATTIIGNAVSDYIAEAKYKRITHRENPFSKFNFIGIADEEFVKYLPEIAASDELKVDIQAETMTYTEKKYKLNQNLSHYVLVKDQTTDKTGLNKFLERLTRFLSFSQDEDSNPSLDGREERGSIETNEIPVVSIIIKGGFGCAELVLQQLENAIPVVVLKGSGGLADLLAFVELEIRDRGLTEWDEDFVETHLKPELTNRIHTLFPEYKSNEKPIDMFRDNILRSVRKSRPPEGGVYLTVVNMYDIYTCKLENLTEILLSALFKTQESVTPSKTGLGTPSQIKTDTIKKDLNLCVDWNCPDVAKREVLTKDPAFALNDEKRLFEESLIRKNRCDFVDLFLSQKFRIRGFLTPKRLIRMFRKIHTNEFFSTVCWEGILGRSPEQRQGPRFIYNELNWLVEALTGNGTFFDENELSLYVMEQFTVSEREAERKAHEIIVLWGVLHFRKRLVRILWRHSERPINLALIIAMSYDRLSWYVNDESLREELKSESKQFLAFSLSVVDKCYKESALRSENVLNEAPQDWNYKTAVDLAAFGRFRVFFSHPSCQRWLTNKFYGNIAVKDMRQKWFRLPTLARILLSAYLVFPSYWWIKITNNPKTETEEDVDEDEDEDYPKKKSKEVIRKSSKESKSDKTVPESNKKNGQNGSASDKAMKTSQKKDENKKPDLISGPSPDHNEKVDKTSKKAPVIYQPSVWTIIYEVWTAPITKFWNFQFFYTFYLSIFCIALLYPRCGNYYLDSVVAIWSFLLLLDDISQTYILWINANISITFRSMEIIFKIIFISIFSLSRLFLTSSLLSAYQEKVLMSLALMHAFYVLLSKFLPISATLGPLLYRLKIMLLVDFLNFIRLSILVMISFGVIIQAILYPDLPLNYELFRRTFHRAFFSLFLTPADELLEDQNCSDNKHTINTTGVGSMCSASVYADEQCRNPGFWPYIFMIGYFILLKLILLTLLFALFASSATALTADTDAIWKFQRYGLVLDFASRGPMPPPLNILYYMFLSYKWVYNLFKESIKKPRFKIRDFKLFILYSKSQPNTRHLADDEYNYFKLLASETFDELQNKITGEHMASLQWERIQALSEETEFQRQMLRQLKGKISEMDRYLKKQFTEPKPETPEQKPKTSEQKQ